MISSQAVNEHEENKAETVCFGKPREPAAFAILLEVLKQLDDDVLTPPIIPEPLSHNDFVPAMVRDSELQDKSDEIESGEKTATAKEGKDEADNAASGNSHKESGMKMSPEESPSEKKKKREQKRRNVVNGGLNTLMDLVFVIDPQIKERSSLNRVELVSCVVATLARIHEENEVRKSEIIRLARGHVSGSEVSGTTLDEWLDSLEASSVSLPSSFFEPDHSVLSPQAKEQLLAETESERRRKREKKRREGVSKGLDKLAQLIFLINPRLKSAAVERAMNKSHHFGGSTLLQRVELVNAAVVSLVRVHLANEVHKMIIAHITGTSAPIPSSLQEIMVAIGLDVMMKSVAGTSLLRNEERTENRMSGDSMEDAALLEQAPVVENSGTEEDGPVKKKAKM